MTPCITPDTPVPSQRQPRKALFALLHGQPQVDCIRLNEICWLRMLAALVKLVERPCSGEGKENRMLTWGSSPECAGRSDWGDVILVLIALPRPEVGKNVVAPVAFDACWRWGVTRDVVGARVSIVPVKVMGCNVGVLVRLPILHSTACMAPQSRTMLKASQTSCVSGAR